MATIDGTNGADTLTGTAVSDTLTAMGGDDTLNALDGDDTLDGGLGNDSLRGAGGADRLIGGAGNDLFSFTAGTDSSPNANWQVMPGAADPRTWDVITDFTQGVDRIDLSAFLGNADLAWSNTTPAANAVWFSRSGTSTFVYVDIDGTPPPDLMIELQDTAAITLIATDFVGLVGSAGQGLTGGAGADTLVGTSGDDRITGNGGADRSTGGAGSDAFVYLTATDSSPNTDWQVIPGVADTRTWDVITDFTQGIDRIDLSAYLGAADLAWANTTPSGSAVWFARSGTSTFVYVDLDGTPPPDLMIELQNTGAITLTATDFIGVVGSSVQGLTGGPGADTLVGTAGNDSITGNGGADRSTGGAGSDAFVYLAASDSSPNTNWQTTPGAADTRTWDVITDFTQGVDWIDLGSFLGAVDLAWANTTPSASAVWFAQSGTSTFVYVDIDGSPPPDLMIELQNTTATSLAATDFVGVVGGSGNTNLAPVITSPAAFTIAENTTSVTTVSASDAQAIIYSIVAGGDAARFAINATTGALSFIAAPDFENPTDAGGNNIYNLNIQASDGTLATSQAIAVTVTNVDIEPIAGTTGNDSLTGTTADDSFNISQGGNDTISAGSGNDMIVVGAALTSSDRINGGTELTDNIEIDTLVLNGNYAAGVVFTATTVTNMEEIILTGGNNYSITTNDATLSNNTLTIDGSQLGATNTMTIVASAESQAGSSYTMISGAGNDQLSGGAGADFFDISLGGNDTVSAGSGSDTIYTGAALSATDRINGGNGNDFLYLAGNYASGITFGTTTVTNIEVVIAQAGNTYRLTTNNSTVSAGQSMTIDGYALQAGNSLIVNAAAETDATAIYRLNGGAGADSLRGGAGADVVTGNGGSDTLTGGLGNDVFDYNRLDDSGDVITDFSRSGANGTDRLDLRDLMQTFVGYTGANAFSGGYLQFDISSGSNTVIRVDSNGGADAFATLATITTVPAVLLVQADTANYIV